MKRLFAIFVIMTSAWVSMAQEPFGNHRPGADTNPPTGANVIQELSVGEQNVAESRFLRRSHASFVNPTDCRPDPISDFRGHGYGTCPRFAALHDGLNVSFGTSVFALFGKNVFHGVGFTQDISLLYAVPLSAKTSLTVGGFADFTQYVHTSSRRVGMSVALHHDFNEKWSATVFGHKTLANDGLPFVPYDDFRHPKNSLGATVRYRPGENFSLEVTMQVVCEPDGWQHPFGRPAGGQDWRNRPESPSDRRQFP